MADLDRRNVCPRRAPKTRGVSRCVEDERGIAVAQVMYDHPGDPPQAAGEARYRSSNRMPSFESLEKRRGIPEELWATRIALRYWNASGRPA